MDIRDPVFADAVAAIDTGDVAKLDALLTQNPRLVTDPLPSREEAIAYFADPYLLWFIAENPIRNDRLPTNIVAVAELIVSHLDRLAPASRQHQLDYTVGLIATGKVPREAGVQLALIDALIARGARASGLDATVAHNEMAAARRLIHHGAPLTLTASLYLGLKQEAQRLLPDAGPGERGDALLAAASLGLTDAIRFLLNAGIDPNTPSARLHRHATALHEAALTGKTDLCQLLVDAGASLTVRDQMWDGTPAGWADHAGHHALAARLRAEN